MKELIDKVLNFVATTFSVTPTIALIICIATLVVVLVLIVVIIVAIIKRAKKKKIKAMSPARPEEIAVTSVSDNENDEIIEETIKEEQTPIEVKEEPKKEVKKDKKTAVNKQEKETPASNKRTVMGKWIVEYKGEEEYLSKLLASNGEVMLTSEIYKSEDGAIAGISSICRGVQNGKFVIYQDKNSNYYYKLKSSNNRLLCVGEIYKSKDQCLKAVETVKRIASGSMIAEDLVMGEQYTLYTPQEISSGESKKSAKGKWKIEKGEQGEFSAKLYANNGQLMLSTEEVATKKSAENAIESVKKNSVLGNFIIDRDKFGRYYYKLRNAQKSVICIGEAYESLDSCISAIESVRRFALNADLPKTQTK